MTLLIGQFLHRVKLYAGILFIVQDPWGRRDSSKSYEHFLDGDLHLYRNSEPRDRLLPGFHRTQSCRTQPHIGNHHHAGEQPGLLMVGLFWWSMS